MKLNVIIRDFDNLVVNLYNIKFNKKIIDLEELSNYLNSKFSSEGLFFSCEYDIECKKKYLYELSKINGKLNLDTDFQYLTFKQYYKVTKKSPLTITGFLVGGGAGGPGMLQGLQTFFFIRDVIVLFSTIFYVIILLVLPFRKIKKKYGYGKNFVGDIINSQEEWAFGFFDMKRIKFNKLLEFSVMHKLGYKLKNKIWIKNQIFDFTENYNKYDYF